MCDCPKEQKDDKTVGRIGSETVTIFSNCSKSYRPGKDILDQAPPGPGWLPIDSVQYNSSNTSYDTKTSSRSTESSSDSSRTYKFVCLSKCNCSEEIEDDCGSPICYEINRIKDVVDKEPDIKYTLAIIKPEATVYRKQIEHEIYTEGFEICQTRWLQLTPEQASEFYNDNFGDMSFPHLVAYMSSGPIIVFVLAKQNAVEEWKRIMGPAKVAEARLYFPDSIRARYGCKGDSIKNVVHGSNSCEEATKEIHFFFPEFITEPLLRDEIAEDYLWRVINPVLVEGLTECCKSKPADPVLWLAHWLIMNNPNKPKLPEDLALIPTQLFKLSY